MAYKQILLNYLNFNLPIHIPLRFADMLGNHGEQYAIDDFGTYICNGIGDLSCYYAHLIEKTSFDASQMGHQIGSRVQHPRD